MSDHHPNMKVDRVQELIDFFEAGAPHFEFNMKHGFVYKPGDEHSTLSNHCGAAGCIAGFAFMMATKEMASEQYSDIIAKMKDAANTEDRHDEVELDYDMVRSIARDYLGLSREPLSEIIGDREVRVFDPPPEVSRENITPKDAAEALRKLLRNEDPWL
jgi:hypothetical protein